MRHYIIIACCCFLVSPLFAGEMQAAAIMDETALHLTDGTKLVGVVLCSGSRGYAVVIKGEEIFVPADQVTKTEKITAQEDKTTESKSFPIGRESGEYRIGGETKTGEENPAGENNPPKLKPLTDKRLLEKLADKKKNDGKSGSTRPFGIINRTEEEKDTDKKTKPKPEKKDSKDQDLKKKMDEMKDNPTLSKLLKDYGHLLK